MKVIDKGKLDKLIALTREYIDIDYGAEERQSLLAQRSRLVTRWDKLLEIGERIAMYIGDVVYAAISMRRDVEDWQIYAMLGCIGYEVKEVKEND